LRIVVVVDEKEHVKEWFEEDSLRVTSGEGTIGTTDGVLRVYSIKSDKLLATFNKWDYWREVEEK
jgi:hypothetical protein